MNEKLEEPEEFVEDTAAPEPPRGAKHIIAVGGGKGGVGKSLLAANLGIHFAQLGKRVVLFDADFGGSNLHAFIGIERPQLTLDDYFAGRVKRIEDCVVKTPVNGLGLVSSEGDPLWTAHPRQETRSRLLEQMRALDVDYLICDLPPGAGSTALDFFLLAHLGILVVVPEPTSVESMHRFIKNAFIRRLRTLPELESLSLNRDDDEGSPAPLDIYQAARTIAPQLAPKILNEILHFRPRVVVNQVRTRTDLELGFHLCAAGRRRMGIAVDYLGHLEADDAVWQAVRKRRPLVIDYPEAKVSKNIERITRRLIALESEKPAPVIAPRSLLELTHYEVLEIDPGASEEEIRRAYKRVRDIYASESMVVRGLFSLKRLEQLQHRIEVAHGILLGAEARGRYDLELFPDGTRHHVQNIPPPPPHHEEIIRPDIHVPEPEITADAEFTGALLKQVREARSIDLVDIAQQTKIGVAHLRAIEEETWLQLPAVVYVRGYLVAYARYLKLDPKRVAQSYLARYQRACNTDDE